ncbi:hypothetical protein LX77_01612 [Gelidibacter algens]|uniref:Lipoprotein n=1 Tax=Gelidibacter algens TaxID=49280 RepID=A0A1A7R559_9FLAO|nr:hypothetical protein [Gelidibacter algens]OBX25897.1 hypothetical protein A9996_07165 [Gelidibacter algens]RAJ25309.1 hypothetical protein LX77_01612 [Gelidibacter algens]
MKKLLIFASALILTSCGTNKFLTNSVTASEISKLGYFEPSAYIQYIEKGNKPTFSDSLSGITRAKLDSLITENKSSLPLTKKIVIENNALKTRVENEMGYLAQLIGQQRNLKDIPLTPAIDSLMETNNQRFALSTVATGFGRRKGNYGGQVAKGLAVGILTLGMVVPSPIKSNLTLHAFIFDSEKNEIVFYKKLMPNKEKEPTDPEFIERQLTLLFNGYFYDKK